MRGKRSRLLIVDVVSIGGELMVGEGGIRGSGIELERRRGVR